MPDTTTTAPPIGHIWEDDDDPVVAIDPQMPLLQPGTDPKALTCPTCATEPYLRLAESGHLLYAS
ncbi:hypothetical protein [Streptacidiphilus monticola]|uniref:Zinc-finger domain-containing protein n=1 Tax=Streptacidiphilus monticola TaxID=2161674 RepID=A0ABW1G9V3_9ACTN